MACNIILILCRHQNRLTHVSLFYFSLLYINMVSRLPLVIILGATGTGKTKLSLELAQKFGGEIIGADSMQVYKGLDIITAKATKEEQSLAPHHLIDVLEPNETFTVIEYRNHALSVINKLFSKNKLPIVVGGTNYYIEALLWKILIEDANTPLCNEIGKLPDNEHELPSEELHKKLKILDPAMAKRLHPNNKRKIMRSLEILYQKGKKHSDLIKEQRTSKGGSVYGGGLRFPNPIILWLTCEQLIHDERLNSRVEVMIAEGLLQELTHFHEVYNQRRINNTDPDYTKGIFQSIGFKEFHSYLILNEEDRQNEDGQSKLKAGIEQLKLVTRRYAKKQNRWIRNRFLSKTDREVPPVYALDTSDVSQWLEKVTTPAVEIIESYISQKQCNHKQLEMDSHSSPNNDDDSYECEICNRVFVGHFQWSSHMKSNRHRKMVESKAKKEKLSS